MAYPDLSGRGLHRHFPRIVPAAAVSIRPLTAPVHRQVTGQSHRGATAAAVSHQEPTALRRQRRYASQIPRTEEKCSDAKAEPPGRCHICPRRVRLNVGIHQQLVAAVEGRRGTRAADCLCEACVLVLGVDAAAISLVFDGTNSGTLGSSGAPARVYDELQFSFGEGPCRDAVTRRGPILAVRRR